MRVLLVLLTYLRPASAGPIVDLIHEKVIADDMLVGRLERRQTVIVLRAAVEAQARVVHVVLHEILEQADFRSELGNGRLDDEQDDQLEQAVRRNVRVCSCGEVEG